MLKHPMPWTEKPLHPCYNTYLYMLKHPIPWTEKPSHPKPWIEKPLCPKPCMKNMHKTIGRSAQPNIGWGYLHCGPHRVGLPAPLKPLVSPPPLHNQHYEGGALPPY